MSSSVIPASDQRAVASLHPPARLPVLAIVVPCYNEQEVLPETTRRLCQLLSELVEGGQIDGSSRVWLIDDGSRDRTWQVIDLAAAQPDSRVCGIKLSRNRGHQIALLAGLLTAQGEVLISVDADLQDDLNVIPQMLDEFSRGHDIVYGVRKSRDTDTFFNLKTAVSRLHPHNFPATDALVAPRYQRESA